MSFEASQSEGRERKFSDAQLRADIGAGLKKAEIAKKYEVSASAVSQRCKQLGLTTAIVATVAPYESQRFASRTVDAMGQITKNLGCVNKLQDACDEWLTDAHDPEKYDLGPRADEVLVTYLIPGDRGMVKQKDTLENLLARAGVTDVEEVSSKSADPRELILKTAAEARQTISLCADLAKRLADIQSMQALRDAIITEIAKADPDAADRIRQAVQNVLAIAGVLDAPPDVRWSGVN
jgi:hypothetical protein